jgi:large subunit ribosomal protein L25
MAETYVLNAQTRTVTGKKVGALRRAGLIPAIVYGPNTPPIPVQVDERETIILLFKAGGTHVIDLNIDGRVQKVLAREVQRHVVRGSLVHIDFLAVDSSTRIRMEVPVHFVGEAPAERARLGVLLNGVGMIEIEALPGDLVENIEVDLSSLKELNDAIFVRDLKVNPAIHVLSDPDGMIVRVALQEVQDEGTDAPVGSAEPEVIEKGKKDDEDEA